jgi:hypothetical protein
MFAPDVCCHAILSSHPLLLTCCCCTDWRSVQVLGEAQDCTLLVALVGAPDNFLDGNRLQRLRGPVAGHLAADKLLCITGSATGTAAGEEAGATNGGGDAVNGGDPAVGSGAEGHSLLMWSAARSVSGAVEPSDWAQLTAGAGARAGGRASWAVN